MLIAQVVKEEAGKCGSGRARRLYQGRATARAAVIKTTQGHGGINTADIERLNATFRRCLGSRART